MTKLEGNHDHVCSYQTNFDMLHPPKVFEYCNQPATHQGEESKRYFCNRHVKKLKTKGITK